MIKKNGVSLIILVITIIVIIILSGAAILTMKDQDTINKSKRLWQNNNNWKWQANL